MLRISKFPQETTKKRRRQSRRRRPGGNKCEEGAGGRGDCVRAKPHVALGESWQVHLYGEAARDFYFFLVSPRSPLEQVHLYGEATHKNWGAVLLYSLCGMTNHIKERGWAKPPCVFKKKFILFLSGCCMAQRRSLSGRSPFCQRTQRIKSQCHFQNYHIFVKATTKKNEIEKTPTSMQSPRECRGVVM